MKRRDRPCAVCGLPVLDAPASDHFARVLWLCERHSYAFHGKPLDDLGRTWLAEARAQATTSAAWRVLDDFVQIERIGHRMACRAELEAACA